MSPTARTLEWLRKEGYTAQVVERWNPYAKVRVDLFGIIDVVALKEGAPGVLGVQATSTSNVSARVTKCQASPHLKLWTGAGNKMEVHGWAKRGGRGERKVWTLVRKEL